MKIKQNQLTVKFGYFKEILVNSEKFGQFFGCPNISDFYNTYYGQYTEISKETEKKYLIRPNQNTCVFPVSRPYLGFPDPKYFILITEQNTLKYTEIFQKTDTVFKTYL